MWRRVLRAPLVHFLAGGAALFVLDARWQEPAARVASSVRAPIVITAAQVEQLRDEFLQEMGRSATAADERAMLAHLVDDELLYQEALARGLDRGDRSVRWRLVEKMRGVTGEEDGAGDDEALYQRAIALGLDRDDTVIRRLLVEKMRLLSGVESVAPSDAELEAYLEQHRELYRQPARLSLWHVFLSAERRGADTETAARALLAELRARPTAPADAAGRGDSFPLASRVQRASKTQLAKTFGPAFAAEVMRLPAGGWAGPVRSAYGLHLVWIDEKTPETVAPLAAVRAQVARALASERQERRIADLVRDLRARYEVRVESPDRSAGS